METFVLYFIVTLVLLVFILPYITKNEVRLLDPNHKGLFPKYVEHQEYPELPGLEEYSKYAEDVNFLKSLRYVLCIEQITHPKDPKYAEYIEHTKKLIHQKDIEYLKHIKNTNHPTY